MLWLKTMGIVLVVSGFGSYGLMGARSIEKRVEQIKSVRLAMGFLEKEITYLHTPLPIALNRASQSIKGPASCLFSHCSRSLQDRQGITIKEAWSQSLENMRMVSDLTNQDLELLQTLSKGLYE